MANKVAIVILADTETSEALGRVAKAVKDKVAGVCEYCANAFDVTDEIKQANLPIAGDYQGHPSFRQLVSDGYQIITF